MVSTEKDDSQTPSNKAKSAGKKESVRSEKVLPPKTSSKAPGTHKYISRPSESWSARSDPFADSRRESSDGLQEISPEPALPVRAGSAPKSRTKRSTTKRRHSRQGSQPEKPMNVTQKNGGPETSSTNESVHKVDSPRTVSPRATEKAGQLEASPQIKLEDQVGDAEGIDEILSQAFARFTLQEPIRLTDVLPKESSTEAIIPR